MYSRPKTAKSNISRLGAQICAFTHEIDLYNELLQSSIVSLEARSGQNVAHKYQHSEVLEYVDVLNTVTFMPCMQTTVTSLAYNLVPTVISDNLSWDEWPAENFSDRTDLSVRERNEIEIFRDFIRAIMGCGASGTRFTNLLKFKFNLIKPSDLAFGDLVHVYAAMIMPALYGDLDEPALEKRIWAELDATGNKFDEAEIVGYDPERRSVTFYSRGELKPF